MKLLIYTRVSTQDQNVEQQATYCKEWANTNGHEVVWTIKDKESGRKPLSERERFIKIIKNQYNFKYDAVLVYNTDRLTRDFYDGVLVERYFRDNWDTCKLLSCSENIDLSSASGRMMYRIKTVVNSHMVEDMIEKTMIGVNRALKEGKYKGGKVGRTWKK
jgi:site-specific DNA recombinase